MNLRTFMLNENSQSKIVLHNTLFIDIKVIVVYGRLSWTGKGQKEQHKIKEIWVSE